MKQLKKRFYKVENSVESMADHCPCECFTVCLCKYTYRTNGDQITQHDNLQDSRRGANYLS